MLDANPFNPDNAKYLLGVDTNVTAHKKWPAILSGIEESTYNLYTLANLTIVYCVAFDQHDEEQGGEIINLFNLDTILSAQLIKRIGQILNSIIVPKNNIIYEDDVYLEQLEKVLIKALHSKYIHTKAEAYYWLNLNHFYINHESIKAIKAFDEIVENQQLILEVINRIAEQADAY
ncbi:MAG: hypothetical protein CO073_02810 [Candidatus Komeilibacteria bacterium CG_4_9_14_0_8_um_filter_36_9]|uniref:Uncharacterized protein n=1 Tax=Candidatus Komeilibacteria bacterium CG_4_9_14_0_8_um_filter_36_9 TaxID=1974473 RepID=A0A2M8DR53_9BACT|nr:MAG: hypothetical protein CO073_02810 [Candidatus Komeilibacteria bacterium CG_4_9_14_0_8_um_filter_36_9]